MAQLNDSHKQNLNLLPLIITYYLNKYVWIHYKYSFYIPCVDVSSKAFRSHMRLILLKSPWSFFPLLKFVPIPVLLVLTTTLSHSRIINILGCAYIFLLSNFIILQIFKISYSKMFLGSRQRWCKCRKPG